MAKEATLPRAYAFNRKIYTPEDTEIPDELFDVLVDAGVLDSDGSANEEEDELFAGLTEEQAENLREAGFEDEEDVQAATVEDLEDVDKIGPATAKKLKERAG